MGHSAQKGVARPAYPREGSPGILVFPRIPTNSASPRVIQRSPKAGIHRPDAPGLPVRGSDGGVAPQYFHSPYVAWQGHSDSEERSPPKAEEI